MKEATISPRDGEALEALLAARNQGGLRLTDVDPRRTQRVAQVLSLLDEWPVEEPSADLVDRTLAQVAEARQQGRFAAQIEQLKAVPRHRFGWYEIGAVAASLILMASLALPMLWNNPRPATNTARQSGIGPSSSSPSRVPASPNQWNIQPGENTMPVVVWPSDAHVKVGTNGQPQLLVRVYEGSGPAFRVRLPDYMVLDTATGPRIVHPNAVPYLMAEPAEARPAASKSR